MRRRFIGGLLLIIVAIVSCQTTRPLETIKAPVKDHELLIAQLGDDDWRTRETAQQALTELGETLIEKYRRTKMKHVGTGLVPVREKLRTIYSELKELAQALREGHRDKDPEIKVRVNQVRQHLYVRTQPKIAFVSFQNGNAEIYVMDADGKNQKRLTQNLADDGEPAWSPDGTKIAFVSGEYDRGKWRSDSEIYVINTDGKNLRRLTENEEVDESPAWSPDGTKIAFVSNREWKQEIYVMDTNGENQKRLTENKAWNDSPTWSPDGTKIAFVRNSEIYVMDGNGRNQRRLTENRVYDGSPAWNPDGTKIAFYSYRDGNLEIYVMDVNGENETNLTKNSVNGWFPVWSPDGSKVAFVSRNGIYVMKANGKNQKKLTEGSSPAWCPLSFPEISALFTAPR